MSDLDLTHRPRRLRINPQSRQTLPRITLRRSDIIVPVFACEGKGAPRGALDARRLSDVGGSCTEWLAGRAQEGFKAHPIFGVIDRAKKDAMVLAGPDENNIVCQLPRSAAADRLPMAGITDLCFCEYTDHGHCGPLTADKTTVKNDETVERLVKQAVNHANAGAAAAIAPSCMIDGTVGALRSGLDAAGFVDVSVLSYSVKYSSAFDGPFRDAADLCPLFGDRRSYQMDCTRGVEEAIFTRPLLDWVEQARIW